MSQITRRRFNFNAELDPHKSLEGLLFYLAKHGHIPWEAVGPIDPEDPPRREINNAIVQRAISEKEVEAYLEKGFTFKAQLQNGMVIVETTIKAADIAALASENVANFAKTQVTAATEQLTKKVLAKIDVVASSQDPILPSR
jgi:hypothetical protein